MISKNYMFHLLVKKFRNIGLDRTFDSLTVKELDDLSEELCKDISEADKKEDEPPF